MKASFASRFIPFAAAAAVAAGTALADTHTVAAGATETQSGITETSITVKDGAGTLELSGANTLKRIQVKAGTLHISGGTTTINDSTARSGTAPVDQNLASLAGADGVLIDGGATVTVSGAGYAANFMSGTITINNATLDTSALNNFMIAQNSNYQIGANGVKVIVDNGGTIKAQTVRPASTASNNSAKKELVGLQLNAGGNLYLTQFYVDATAYGRIWFNGGTLHSKAKGELFNNNANWSSTSVTPTVMGGGCFIEDSYGLTTSKPLFSGVGAGETDGGVHVTMNTTTPFFWHAKGSTYNGGTYINGGVASAVFGVSGVSGDDSVFGAVPASPATNIWISGNSPTLFNTNGTFTINANRTIHVANGKILYTGAGKDARLVIGGLVKGETAVGAEYSTGTALRVRNDWDGTTVLSPGAGRTNDIGRLVVQGALEITNGVTMIASASAGTSVDNALMYVTAGSAAASGKKGRVVVRDGGVLYAPQTSTRYAIMANYAQTDICGGTVDMPNVDWLNALNNPTLTTIRDGGTMNVGNFRVAQGVSGNPTVVRLATNGVLRCKQLTLDTSKSQTATFLFDGGYLHPTVSNTSFCASWNNTAWNNITFAVGPGGAGFETALDDNVNIWLYRQLVSSVAAGEKDGGLMARGPDGTAVVLMTNMTYNGATTIDTTLIQQRGGDNLLPAGTDIVLKNGGELSLWTYGNSPRATAATLGGVSGSGTLKHLTAATFSGTFAPSIGGTIEFDSTPISLSGTLEIAGDATGCGKVKFDQAQSLNGLALSVSGVDSFSTADEDKRLYKIVEGNYSGEFSGGVSGLTHDWHVSYKADGVYLTHQDAFTIVVR